MVLIAGPTASRKSALALGLALALDGTVINADSMQVYRDLAVLTAQPGAAEREQAPHRLYGAIDAAEACSAGRWRWLALVEIAAAHAAGRLPILVGGTGLYLRALLDGLAPIPAVPPDARAAARALHARLGAVAFRDAIAALDPAAARRIAANDTQRLVRAYEVATDSGQPLSRWQESGSEPPGLAAAAIVLLPPRERLFAACDARFLAMMEAGAAAEVAALVARNLAPDLPAMKAVGVRELAAYLAGQASREDAIAAAQQATRRYAKRQFTWFRHQLRPRAGLDIAVFSAQFSESMLPEIFAFIRRFLLTVKS
jgi:tRNA dimethylallyltransferase